MKRRKQNSYNEEFKADAIQLAKREGYTGAAKQLGIPVSNLHRWSCEKIDSKRLLPFKIQEKKQADPHKEIARLQKEVEYLRKINDVLKKSTAIFSQDTFLNSN